MRDICSLLWCALVGLFRSRASLEAEILLLRHQLNVLRRKSPNRVAFTDVDRLARHDDHVDCVAGKCVTRLGIERRLPAHVGLPATFGQHLECIAAGGYSPALMPAWSAVA